MSHPVVHFEIGCRDSARTQEFYSKLFDWQIQQAGPAAMITTGGTGIDGHITALGHEPYNYVTVYMQVDDIPAYLEKAADWAVRRSWGPSISRLEALPGCPIPKALSSVCSSQRPSPFSANQPVTFY